MFKKIKGVLASVSPSRSTVRGFAPLAGVSMALAAPLAFAGTGGGGLGAAVMDKMGGVEADVNAIFLLLIGIITAFVLYALIKRAVNKA